MNEHALQVIQFHEALALVAAHAGSALGAEAVRALTPQDALPWIDEELRRVDQMSGLLLRVSDWAVPTIPDARATLERLPVAGAVLEGAELRDLGELARSAHDTRRVVRTHAEHFPLVAAAAAELAVFEAEEAAIRRAIDDGGAVRDDASRELLRLRREIRGARGSIVAKLEAFMAGLAPRFQVADASVSVRDGRYVIPIRREARSAVGGIVHDESATGQTLFVEPPIAVELMNRLRELELAAAREVRRILRDLTALLRPRAAEWQATLAALVAVDALAARARYALHVNARRPTMLPRAARELHIREGYHPLLLAGGGPVVPFDLALCGDERTLLVSGPNTGGKTVLLKAVGLIVALAQSGVLPPVGADTRLPVFGALFADIGDEQSIEASLSTFSAHLRNLREILDHAGPDALALIDEIGSGTDPAEGAVLAQAILHELTARGTLTVASTHLGQLKELAARHAAVVNASLQFDEVELRPTYRLRKGVPGRSYGLAIARRLGFPAALLARAEALLPRQERDVAQLLSELERKERLADERLAAARRAEAAAQALQADAEARERALRERERGAERRAREQARSYLLEARELVESTIRELRGSAAGAVESAQRTARRSIESAVRRHAHDEADAAPAADAGGAAGLGPGDHVRVVQTGARGCIVEVRDGRASVEIGGLRVQMPLGALTRDDAADADESARRPAGGWSGPDSAVRPEIDLRGLRADEAQAQLLPALDAAYRADLPVLKVIHGKGTGALREVVAESLREDRRVRAFRPGGVGEGGSGVTVVEFQ